MFFESHAHYDDKIFDTDREELLNILPNNDIDYVVNIGANMDSSVKCVELTNKYPYMYAAVGVHPHYVDNMKDEDINTLEQLCKQPKITAIGEIGLDFYYNNSSKDNQYKWFKEQLALAKKLNLPVVIHSRDASQDVFDIIKEANLSDREGAGAGVIHCYSGSLEMAKEYIKLGYYIGIGGVVTFKKSVKLINIVKEISLDNILLETDSPYLTPIPFRGKRNDSTNLKYIAKTISEIKNVPLETVASITKINGQNLFIKK